MNFSKVLLIVSSTSRQKRLTWKAAFSTPHLGILNIASVLRMHGYHVNVIDLLVENYSCDEFIEAMRSFGPDVIGISTYTECYGEALEIAQMARHHLPEVRIVLGGAHVTFTYRETLLNPLIDFVVLHEGEFTMLELLEYLNGGAVHDLCKIKGLAFRDRSGDIRVTPKRPAVENLDALPFAARHLTATNSYAVPLSLVSSRGCRGACLFCLSPVFFGRKHRAMSAERLFGEVYSLCSQREEKFFALLDDSFTFSADRVARFCELLVRWGAEVYWFCYSRPEFLSRGLLNKLAKSGCKAIQIGVESGDRVVSRSIKKTIPLSKVMKVAENAREVGIYLLVSFLIGHPTDTKDSINRTTELGKLLSDRYGTLVSYSSITPFPGTKLHGNKEELGIEINAHSWDDYVMGNPVISNCHLSINDIRSILFQIVGEHSEEMLVSHPDEQLMALFASKYRRQDRTNEEVRAIDRGEAFSAASGV